MSHEQMSTSFGKIKTKIAFLHKYLIATVKHGHGRFMMWGCFAVNRPEFLKVPKLTFVLPQAVFWFKTGVFIIFGLRFSAFWIQVSPDNCDAHLHLLSRAFAVHPT